MSKGEDIEEFSKRLKERLRECDREIERLRKKIKKVEQRKRFYTQQYIEIESLRKMQSLLKGDENG